MDVDKIKNEEAICIRVLEHVTVHSTPMVLANHHANRMYQNP